MSTLAANAAGELAGKYLTFRLAHEEYGVEILKVQEIVGMMNVTRVPRTPEFIRGVVNLRGKVIPVLDLRRKFRIEEMPDTEKTCIVVLRIQDALRQIVTGAIVDEVCEVIDVKADQIEATPEFGAGVQTEFIRAMAKTNHKVLTLLDIDLVLTLDELAQAGEAAQATV